MNCLLSMNIRGLGGMRKLLSIRHFLRNKVPSIIFIQETMQCAKKATSCFNAMFPEWHLAARDAFGRSGGELVMWDPAKVDMKAYGFFGGILLTGFIRGFKQRIHLINIYAPYMEKLIFWRRMATSGILMFDNLILVGDFNLSLHEDEIWGTRSRK